MEHYKQKGYITKVGTATKDENGKIHLSGWGFTYIEIGGEHSFDKRTISSGGYTADELYEIANNQKQPT